MNENNEKDLEILELSDEELNAYSKMLDEDVPDLWNRIELGFEEINKQTNENNNVVSINTQKSKRSKKGNRKTARVYFSVAAACILVALIVVPYAMNMSERNKKSSDINMITTAADIKADEAPVQCESAEDNSDEGVESDAALEPFNGEGSKADDNAMELENQEISDSEIKLDKLVFFHGKLYAYSDKQSKLPDGYVLAGKTGSVVEVIPDKEYDVMGIASNLNIYVNPKMYDIIVIEESQGEYAKYVLK